MFNAQQRIRQLMDERGWTIYRLAQESKLSIPREIAHLNRSN